MLDEEVKSLVTAWRLVPGDKTLIHLAVRKVRYSWKEIDLGPTMSYFSFLHLRAPANRLGDEERRLMHLVPAPAVRLMERRVLSRPGINSPWASSPLTLGLLILVCHSSFS